MVFYLKYRPQTLDELIGQENVKQTLQKAFSGNRLAHAYLFCGPRGTGKTSTARILAKLVNCESQNVILGTQSEAWRTPESKKTDPGQARMTLPCNTCASCLSITDGSNLDLIEIDAASNRGIDDIRDLREKIKLAPTQAKKKVYIIDEVHMLTNEAFNALLKTLEEPPSHVLFILATTEVHKIPQTILSRVQKLDFKNATEVDLLEALKRVTKEEKIEVEEEALKLLAKKSEGSFRDSLKLLDQLSSLGEKITVSQVEEILRSGKFESLTNLLEALSQKDSSLALKVVEDQVEAGINIKEYLFSLMDLFRSILLIKGGALQVIKDQMSEEKFTQINALSDKFQTFEIIKILELLLKAQEQMKFASIISLPLEIAVVEATQPVIPALPVIPIKPALSAVEGLEDDKKENVRTTTSEEPLRATVRGEEKPTIEGPIVLDQPTSSEDLAKLMDKWTYILETIKPYNYSLEALLKQARVLSCEGAIVILEVPYSFHQRILEAPKSRNLLESVLSDVLGKQARVSTKLGKRPVRVEELANIELAADDEIIKVAAEIFNSETVN